MACCSPKRILIIRACFLLVCYLYALVVSIINNPIIIVTFLHACCVHNNNN